MTKTVLELDLVGYSTIAQTLEQGLDVGTAPNLNAQIQSFIDAGLAAVRAERPKTVMQTTGDGAILVFDRPADAHDFAAAVNEATRAHNHTKSDPIGKRVFRIGVATGDLVMTPKSAGGYEIGGMAIARAVRLEAKAKPGEVLVDATTHAALSPEQKNRYGARESVAGKRDEVFDAYRCVLDPAGPAEMEFFTRQSERIAPSRLRHGADHLFGREKELAVLDAAWTDPTKHVLTIVAWGGVGKTALVVDWTARLAQRNYDGARYFDWSFYSQGTREQGNASADTFIAAALKFFGDEPMANSPASPWDKGARLANLIAQQRTLLILDGLEPLQYPPGPLTGQLKDPAIEVLLRTLAQRNPGLCVVTTRERVADLAPFRDTVAPEWELHHLPIPVGIDLLKDLGVRGTQTELQELVEDVKGHALTLNLIGRFLVRAHQGDIRKRGLVKFDKADATIQGGHAFKTIHAYETWLAQSGDDGVRQLAILRLLGLFDRPADAACLAALRKSPAIAGLTEPLVGLSEEDWNLAVSALADCGLLSPSPSQGEGRGEGLTLDAHPLLREYFAHQLRGKTKHGSKAWRSAHRRLYEHLTTTTEHRPDTLAGLQPLYQAVAHGCLAGLHQEARAKVYRDRILRGTGADGFYTGHKLGAIGADLGAVAWFFEKPWRTLSPSLAESTQAWLLSEAAFFLRTLGRPTEAVDPMRASLDRLSRDMDWKRASAVASNLSELQLTLGRISDALRDAEQAVDYAGRVGAASQQMINRTTLANAHHEAGRRTNALALFREAEATQARGDAEHPLLYSLRGFQYCDLLLSEAERVAWQRLSNLESEIQHYPELRTCDDVEQRATQTLEWVTTEDWLIDIALDHLTLGRTALYRAILTQPKTRNQQPDSEPARPALNSPPQKSS